MQEIISQIVARVQTIFSQLGDQVRAAMENAAAGKAILAALDVICPWPAAYCVFWLCSWPF